MGRLQLLCRLLVLPQVLNDFNHPLYVAQSTSIVLLLLKVLHSLVDLLQHAAFFAQGRLERGVAIRRPFVLRLGAIFRGNLSHICERDLRRLFRHLSALEGYNFCIELLGELILSWREDGHGVAVLALAASACLL